MTPRLPIRACLAIWLALSALLWGLIIAGVTYAL